MKKLNIELTLEEGQMVFQSLAEFPFKMVYELIGKLNKKSGNLIIKGGQQNDKISLELNSEELLLMLRSLEKKPFADVHQLINKLNGRYHEVG